MSKLPAGLTRRGNMYWGSWWEDGKRIRKSLGTHDLDEALQAFREKRAANPPARSSGPTFADMAAIYLDALTVRTDKPKTVTSGRSSIKALNRWFGDVLISDLTEAHYNAFVKARKQGVADATVARDQRYLKAILRYAVEAKVIPELPFSIRIKALKRTKGRHITPKQIKTLLGGCPVRC